MKKTHLLYLLPALALTLAAPARADHGWGLFASYWDTKDAGSAPGLGLSIAPEIMSGVCLDFRLSYFPGLGESAGGVEVDMDVTPFEFGLLFQGDDEASIQWSAGGGLGYYSVSADIINQGLVSGSPDIESAWGGYVVAGLDYTFSRNVESIQAKRATLFAEAMYRMAEVDRVRTTTGTLVIGEGDLSGLGVNLGLKLRW